jgi:tetratricopeptide (TPR) repeat protein
VDTFDRALAMFPDADDLLYSKAECLYELDRYREARETLTQIIAGAGQFQYRGGVPGDIREQRAPRKLADICRLERDFASAESLLMRLLARFPHDTLSWQTLGRVFLDSRQRLKLLAVIEHLQACPQGDVFATMLMAMWHLNAREFDAAGQAIEQLIGLAPLMPMPRILRVEWLNQIAAPITSRIQACRDLLRLQPGNQEARHLLAGLESLANEKARVPVPASGLASVAGREVVPTSVAIGG